MTHYLDNAEQALQNLKTSESGLSQSEAEKRLEEHGRNELAKAKKKSLGARFGEQILNPMILLLIGAAMVSLFFAIQSGHAHEYAETAVILAVVILNSVLGVFQESKAEKAIEALQEMSASTAKVRRGGEVMQIPAAELVVGDIVLLEAGDSVPADVRLIQSASLRIEEAALTGESVPVDKIISALTGDDSGSVALGDRKNMAYMSCSVAYGRGEGVVTGTGMDTEVGKIAGIIQSTAQGETPLQKRMSQIGKIMTTIVLIICVGIFAMRLITEGQFTADIVLDSFMVAIALAVAAIPEGLAAVVTIVLSLGVTKMAKRNAIIRRLTAVETLGCAQVICSDKTGTLTQNKMTVVETYGDVELLARAMALCCDSHLSADGKITGDPTENALIAFALEKGIDKNAAEAETPRVAEAPFDSMRKMMSTIHKKPDGYVQYTKGAPDEVLRVCTHALVDGKAVPLTPEITQEIAGQNNGFAEKALRVLACAYKDLTAVPDDHSPENLEHGLTFIGLEAMIDPVRPEVLAAVESSRSAGIKVVMITGDHKDTAIAIAKQIGIIETADQAITGRDLDDISDEEFEQRVENIFVYARVQPEHKVRIVEMWKKRNHVTAMTGDGVNDAPAIKSGDIGIGMGITGTDVTKNVADMVLADDNFATIVSAVEEGRKIYENIRKTLQFLLSTNFAEVFAVLVATLMGFVLFRPIHLLFINLVTDTLPAFALGMERAEKGLMDRPPRGMTEGVFARGLGVNVIYQGFIIGALTLAGYFIVEHIQELAFIADGYAAELAMAMAHDYAMTAAFFTLSMCEVFQAITLRSITQSTFTLGYQNRLMWMTLGVSLCLTLSVIYIPPVALVFSLVPLSPLGLGISLALGFSIMPIIEIIKAIQRSVGKRSLSH